MKGNVIFIVSAIASFVLITVSIQCTIYGMFIDESFHDVKQHFARYLWSSVSAIYVTKFGMGFCVTCGSDSKAKGE